MRSVTILQIIHGNNPVVIPKPYQLVVKTRNAAWSAFDPGDLIQNRENLDIFFIRISMLFYLQRIAFQIEWELEEQRFAYYNESCYDFPIEPDTTPALYQIYQSVKQRLQITNDIVFFIDNRMRVDGSCTASADKEYPSIITLSTGAVNTLTDKELTFLIGHELGHLIMQDWLVSFFFNKLYKNRATKFRLHQYHVLDLLSELEADRYGYLACGDLDTFVSWLYKLNGGIDQQRFGVSTDTFLAANQRHMQKFLHGGWLGKRHPANALRIEAIRLFATCKTNRELQSQMKPIINSIQNCDD